MPNHPLNDKIKLVLFASSSIVIPVINQLLKTQQLAGVIVSARQDNDAMQLSHQLQQARIPFQQYNKDNPNLILPLIDRWQANTGLIYTFSHILPENLLQSFSHGIYNLHASALPRYRGAMPLYWQIRHREPESCLSMIKVEQSADSGDIVHQQPMPISTRDTLGSLSTTMAAQAVTFIVEFLNKLAEGTLRVEKQQGEPSSAPMPTPEEIIVDWQRMESNEIAAMARAGNPQFNGATVKWRQSHLALMQATAVDQPGFGVNPGTIIHVGEPEGLLIATRSGALRLDVILINEGIFSGLAFAERFQLDAGMQFS